jgi:hypothetical protein
VDLQSKTQTLEEEKIEWILEKEEFVSRGKEGQETIEKLEKELGEIKYAMEAASEVVTLEKELEDLRNKRSEDLKESIEENSKLSRGEIEGLQSTKIALEEEHEQLVDGLKSKNSALEQEKENLTGERESLVNRDKEQQETIAELGKQLNNLEHSFSELSTAQQQVESIGNEVVELTAARDQESEEFTTQTRALKETIEKLEEKAVSLEAENIKVCEANDRQRLDLETMESKLEQAEISSKERESRLQNSPSSEQVEILNKEIKEVRLKHARESESDETDMLRLRLSAEDLKKKVDLLQQENAKLSGLHNPDNEQQTSNEELAARVNTLEGEKKSLFGEREELLTRVEQLQDTVSTLESRLNEDNQFAFESKAQQSFASQVSMESHVTSPPSPSNNSICKALDFHRTIANLRKENQELESENERIITSEYQMMLRHSTLMKSMKMLEDNLKEIKVLAEKREKKLRGEIEGQNVSLDSLFDDLSSSREDVEILQMEIVKLTTSKHRQDVNQDRLHSDSSENTLGDTNKTRVTSRLSSMNNSSEQAEFLQTIMDKKQENGWNLGGRFSRAPTQPDAASTSEETQALKEEMGTLRSSMVKLQTQYKEESYKNRKMTQELQHENEAILLKNAVLERYVDSLRS